jgi:hypothetical protein
MAVKRADADASRARDGFEARFGAAGAEHGFCRLKDAFAIPNSVGARLARRFLVQGFETGRQKSTLLTNGGCLRITS